MGDRLSQMNSILQDMQKTLKCVICLDLMKNPLTTKCGHSFCGDCIQQIVKLSARGSAHCPLCNATITKRSLGSNAKTVALVTAVRKVIASIKEDCGFEATPSKYHSRPKPYINPEDDDSENEELDEPRRGTRKREVTNHFVAEVQVAKPKPRTRQRLTLPAEASVMSSVIAGMSGVSGSIPAGTGKTILDFISQDHPYSSPTKPKHVAPFQAVGSKETDSKGGVGRRASAAGRKPRGGRAGMEQRQVDGVTKGPASKARAMSMPGGEKTQSKAPATYRGRRELISKSELVSVSQRNEEQMVFPGEVVQSKVPCVKDTLSEELLREQPEDKVARWLDHSKAVGFQIGESQTETSHSSTGPTLEAPPKSTEGQEVENSKTKDFRQDTGNKKFSKPGNIPQLHSKKHIGKEDVTGGETREGSHVDSGSTSCESESHCSKIPKFQISKPSQNSFMLLHSQNSSKVTGSLSARGSKSRGRGVLRLGKGRGRGRGRGRGIVVEKTDNVMADSDFSQTITFSQGAKESTPVAPGKKLMTKLDISEIQCSGTMDTGYPQLVKSSRKATVINILDELDQDAIPDSCPVNTKDKFDSLVDSARTRRHSGRNVEKKNYRETTMDLDEADDFLLFKTPADVLDVEPGDAQEEVKGKSSKKRGSTDSEKSVDSGKKRSSTGSESSDEGKKKVKTAKSKGLEAVEPGQDREDLAGKRKPKAGAETGEQVIASPLKTCTVSLEILPIDPDFIDHTSKGKKVKFSPSVDPSSKKEKNSPTKVPSVSSTGGKGPGSHCGSHYGKKLLEKSRVSVPVPDPGLLRSPGWSHMEGAKQDLHDRHTSLDITGGEGKLAVDLHKEGSIYSHKTKSMAISSEETDMIIDDETQENDVEHLVLSQSKKDKAVMLKDIVSKLKCKEMQEAKLVEKANINDEISSQEGRSMSKKSIELEEANRDALKAFNPDQTKEQDTEGRSSAKSILQMENKGADGYGCKEGSVLKECVTKVSSRTDENIEVLMSSHEMKASTSLFSSIESADARTKDGAEHQKRKEVGKHLVQVDSKNLTSGESTMEDIKSKRKEVPRISDENNKEGDVTSNDIVGNSSAQHSDPQRCSLNSREKGSVSPGEEGARGPAHFLSSSASTSNTLAASQVTEVQTEKLDNMCEQSTSSTVNKVDFDLHKVIPFRAVGSTCSQGCAKASEEAEVLIQQKMLKESECLHAVPCEVYQVLMKYMAFILQHPQAHGSCADSRCQLPNPIKLSKKASSMPSSPTPSKDLQTTSSIPAPHNSNQAVPVDRTKPFSQSTSSRSKLSSDCKSDSSLNQTSNQDKENSSSGRGKVEAEERSVGRGRKERENVNKKGDTDDNRSEKEGAPLTESSERVPATFEFEGSLETALIIPSALGVPSKKKKTGRDDKNVEVDGSSGGQPQASLEIPLLGMKLNKRLQHHDSKESHDGSVNSQQSINSEVTDQSSQNSTSLLSNAGRQTRSGRSTQRGRPTLELVESKAQEKEVKIQNISQKNRKNIVNSVLASDTKDLCDIEKENILKMNSDSSSNSNSSNVSVPKARRKPLQVGINASENIISQHSEDVTNLKKTDEGFPDRSGGLVGESLPVNSKPLFSSVSAGTDTSSGESNKTRNNVVLSRPSGKGEGSVGTVENVSSRSKENEDSPLRSVEPGTRRPFKRIRQPASGDSNSSDSEIEDMFMPRKRRSNHISSGESHGPSSHISRASSTQGEKNQFDVDSEELRDMERFNKNIWDYFGQDPEELKHNCNAADSAEKQECSEPEMDVPLVETEAEHLPSTAEVIDSLSKDVDMIEKEQGRNEDEKDVVLSSQGRTTKSGSLGPSFSASTRRLFNKVNTSLKRAEALFTPEEEEELKKEGLEQIKEDEIRKACTSSDSSSVKDTLGAKGEKEENTEDNVSHSSAYSSQSETLTTQKHMEMQDEVQVLQARVQELEAKMKEGGNTKEEDTEELPPTCPMADSDNDSDELFCSLPQSPPNINSIGIPKLPKKKAVHETPPVKPRGPLKIVCTGLVAIELCKVREMIGKVAPDGTEFCRSWVAGVTHVVVKTSEENMAERTLKYLMGVSCGCWVITYEWIIQSLQARKFLPEEEFEVLDCTGAPGPQRSRLSLAPLFSGCEFCIVPPYVDVTSDQISEMITNCGGVVVKSLQQLTKPNKRKNLTLVVVQLDAGVQHDVEGWLTKEDLVTVAHDWVIECIGMFARICIAPYIASSPTQQQLNLARIPPELMLETQDIME
ncbi:uncharacterized protein LOC143035932 [Oratosquilla oratoria]|uniref:uncharacterized protein LOC143035932 n=1 Tax=Oratosquilla oratoria TaxID=337810 RepID=UPI003F75B4F7